MENNLQHVRSGIGLSFWFWLLTNLACGHFWVALSPCLAGHILLLTRVFDDSNI